jgi:hypothetical protein
MGVVDPLEGLRSIVRWDLADLADLGNLPVNLPDLTVPKADLAVPKKSFSSSSSSWSRYEVQSSGSFTNTSVIEKSGNFVQDLAFGKRRCNVVGLVADILELDG